jgi:DNA damage-binding protein 1
MSYVVTAHRPSKVTHTAVGNFLSPSTRNLLVAKITRVEVYSVTVDGLVRTVDLPIYGRIAVMVLARAPGAAQDDMLVLTEKHHLVRLRWDAASGQCTTVLSCDVKDSLGTQIERLPILITDPTARCAAVHQYPRLLRLVPLAGGATAEAFNVRLMEEETLDVVFLHGRRKLTISVLSRDSEDVHNVRTFEISLADQDMRQGPWGRVNVDPGAVRLIPMPEPYGGVIVVAEQSLTYVKGEDEPVTVAVEPAFIKSFGRVDADGARFLLGGHLGQLLMLVLDLDPAAASVQALKVEALGETSIASAISYVDKGYVYVGSDFGNSQLVKLNPEKVGDPTGCVEVVQTYQHLGPITDFCVMKSGSYLRQGQGQVVTCSGGSKDGTLRVIRNGIGITEQAAVDLPGIKDMWSLRRHCDDRHHAYLVQSFASETRVLELVGADEMAPTTLPNVDEESATLFMGNLVGDLIVQVTGAGVRLLDCATLAECPAPAWAPPGGVRVLVAAGNATQLLLATTGGQLIYLQADPAAKTVVERGSVKLDHEIACIDCSPLGALADDGSPVAASSMVAAVGLWAGVNQQPTVQLLALPSLALAHTVSLEDDVMARSVLMVTLEGHDYLLIALGDGHLLSYKYGKSVTAGAAAAPADASEGVSVSPAANGGDRPACALQDRRRLSVGTQPAALSLFRSRGANHVFAACDRPAVVYAERGGGKLLMSNVNLEQVTRVCGFDTESFPDCLAIATDGALHLGAVDGIQKLHVTSVPLGQQPRRIVHVESARALVVLTEATRTDSNGDETLEAFVRLFSDLTYEPLDEFKLQKDEISGALCVSSFRGEGVDEKTDYVVVGTGHLPATEPESHEGRLLIFTVSAADQKLSLVAERKVNGVIYCMTPYDGRLLCGVNSLVQLFAVSCEADGSLGVKEGMSYHGNILIVALATRGDFVLVGDMMRSVTLLSKRSIGGDGLEQLARDYDASWTMAMEIVGDDTFIVADMSKNLMTLRRNSRAASDAERMQLERSGLFHVGALITKIRHGSLVMQMPDDADAPATKTMIFTTVDGMLGVIATLKQEDYEFFRNVQTAMSCHMPGVGGLEHHEWRKFETDTPTRSIISVGYIDGDLVESFLELPPVHAATVASDVGSSVEELTRRCEAMQRLH